LCQDPGSQTLIPCLTSLVSVCKGFLTDERLQNTDLLLMILLPLENVFERHCSNYHLHLLSNPPCQPLALVEEPSGQLSCLLDFIETLVALKTKLKFKCLPLQTCSVSHLASNLEHHLLSCSLLCEETGYTGAEKMSAV
ncbi:unnamed protein product, partial [Staurois parvus]